MAVRPDIKIEGARDLRRRLREVENDMEDLKALHKEIADMVADRAKQKVPVLSGKLQGTIRGSGTKTAARVKAGNKRQTKAGVPYAGVVHFGTPASGLFGRIAGLPPQPFLYEALNERKPEVIQRYAEGIEEIVEKVF